jgi:hypothetical protein
MMTSPSEKPQTPAKQSADASARAASDVR